MLKCSCLDNDDADHRVMTKTHNRRHYDHRLRRLVSETGNIQLAVGNGVPHSTARDWSRSSSPDVVSLDVVSMSEHALQREVLELRQQNARLTAYPKRLQFEVHCILMWLFYTIHSLCGSLDS